MSKAGRLLAGFAVTFLALVALSAQAGGPIGICNDAGRTVVAYSPAVVNLNYDQGNLGGRSKAAADAIVSSAVALWTNGPTTAITIGRGSDLPEDVTTTNFATYLNNFSDGRNPVIYDTDGSITDLIFGTGAKNNTLGFAGSAWYGASTNPSFNCRYAEGQAVINGFIPISDATMGIAIAHEIGHLIGLDHTQLDNDQGLASAVRPLMYPIAQRGTLSLHEDDVAAVSGLYPAATLNRHYGQLTGVFVLTDGVTPVRGANLWATETSTNKVYSVVSDYRTQNTGFFKLLLPAGNYQLRAGAIRAGFNGGSSVGPYSEVPPSVSTLTPEDSLSFKPPLYVGGNADSGGVRMPTVTLGNGFPVSIAMSTGCAATATFRIDGNGSVGGNCVAAPAVPVCTIAPTMAGIVSGTSQPFTVSCTNSPSVYVWRIDDVLIASGPAVTSIGTGAGLPAGAHTVAVTASNAAGASTPATASLTITAAAGDTTAPTTPTGLSLTAVSSVQIAMSWTASTDDVGVTQYRIYRNSAPVGAANGSPPATGFADTGVSPSTFYSYTVQACDAAGNCSGQSNAASANTPLPVPVCAIAPMAATVVSGRSQNFAASCTSSPTEFVWRVDGLHAASGPAATSFSTGTGLPVGAHTVTVTASNSGGASTPASASLTVIVPAFRTYLSSTGVDGPTCALAAPCRLLAAALAAVADGGEVWMLDSANYNTSPVNVNKSVTILAVPGALGSVVAIAGNAINIATPGVRVALRNLVIASFPGGGGSSGIVMTAGVSLTVANCTIVNLPTNGILVSTAATMQVTDTIIRDNGQVGLFVQNGARATITRATISANGSAGIVVQGGSTADIADSTMTGNLHGLVADSNGAVLRVSVFRSWVVGNTDRGLIAQALAGGSSTLVASDNAVSNNGTGMSAIGSGSRVLASGNTVTNNALGFENSSGLFESASDNSVRNNTAASVGAISSISKL